MDELFVEADDQDDNILYVDENDFVHLTMADGRSVIFRFPREKNAIHIEQVPHSA